jgi:hypothetical protein
MQTLQAMALIEQAVRLPDAQFSGNALEAACRSASRQEKLAVHVHCAVTPCAV